MQKLRWLTLPPETKREVKTKTWLFGIIKYYYEDVYEIIHKPRLQYLDGMGLWQDVPYVNGAEPVWDSADVEYQGTEDEGL